MTFPFFAQTPSTTTETSEFVFTNMPESWGIFVLIAIAGLLVYAAIQFYRKEATPCPKWARVTLILLRSAAILLLIWVFLDPALKFQATKTILPSIFVYRDSSQSMNRKDRYLNEDLAKRTADTLGVSVAKLREQQPERAKIVNALLKESDEEKNVFLDSLRTKGNLRFVDFATAASPVKADSELEPKGQGTDIASGIRSGLEEDLIGALVFATDGQHTSKADVRAAAREARNRNVPLMMIGVGDSTRLKNIEVAEVYADPQVWKGDPFEIQVLLRGQSLAPDESISLELMELAEGGTENLLERKTVKFPEGKSQMRITFSHTPKKAGQFSYTVKVTPLANEATEEDNQPSSPVPVKVLEQRARVLLIAGYPTWDFRGIQRLLTREKSINVSCWLQSIDDNRSQQGDTPITQLPATRKDLFEYDAIVMLDPNPDEFDAEWVALIHQFLKDHGGGFCYMAGPEFSARFLTGTRTGVLAKLLPVRLDDLGRMELANILSTNERVWPLSVVSANLEQPMMRFFPEPESNKAQWEKLAGVYWSFPALESKPAARVLLEHSNPAYNRVNGGRPLLVTGQYGAGRTVYFGFNSSWRWRSAGKDAEFFKTFLGAIRTLPDSRSLSGGKTPRNPGADASAIHPWRARAPRGQIEGFQLPTTGS